MEVRNGGINTRLSNSVIPLHTTDRPDKASYEPLLTTRTKDQYLEVSYSDPFISIRYYIDHRLYSYSYLILNIPRVMPV